MNLIDPIATQASQIKNNLVQDYQGKRYSYDAQGNVVEAKQGNHSLKLSWDNLNRLIQSDNNGQITEYGYDVFVRRLYKKSQDHYGKDSLTLFGWDGDLMIWESRQDQDKSYTKHYIYEPNSFVPVLQTGYHQFIQLIKTPDYSQFKSMPYSIHRDPVWSTDTRKNKAELERVAFYHCDQVGTPQTLSNEKGECIWEIELNTWGKAQKVKAQNQDQILEQTNIRFQGQYYDEETGLHYNRYRYYEPHSGRYISKDPIGLQGGLNNLAYVSDPNQWVDPMGLNRKTYKWKDRNGNQVISDNEMKALEAYQQGIKVDGYKPQPIGSRYATSTNKKSSHSLSNVSRKFDQDYANYKKTEKKNYESLDRGSKQLDQIINNKLPINNSPLPVLKGHNAIGKAKEWFGNKYDQIQKGHENFGKYNPNGSGRDRELDHIDKIAKCILENKCTLDYAICSGGVGPLASGAVVNLHDGSVYITGGVSGTSIPNEITKQLNSKNFTPMQLAKGLSQSVKAKGGGCSFGTITNKSATDRENIADFVNSWLPGKSVTASVGFFGVVGGVTVPHTQEWFDPKAQIGVEWGGGTPRIDMSESTTSKQRIFQIEFLNKAGRK